MQSAPGCSSTVIRRCRWCSATLLRRPGCPILMFGHRDRATLTSDARLSSIIGKGDKRRQAGNRKRSSGSSAVVSAAAAAARAEVRLFGMNKQCMVRSLSLRSFRTRLDVLRSARCAPGAARVTAYFSGAVETQLCKLCGIYGWERFRTGP
jgi:hypothetical protein